MTDIELARQLVALKAHLDGLQQIPLGRVLNALIQRAAVASWDPADDRETARAAEMVAVTIAWLEEVASIGRDIATDIGH